MSENARKCEDSVMVKDLKEGHSGRKQREKVGQW